jgi:diketogulonate reductase-like aldo/keto reductase
MCLALQVPREMMGYNDTKRAVAASMAQLQVGYIDLVMFHHRAADISAEPLSMKPMKAFPEHPDGKWGPPACSLTDPSWQLCQDEGWRALVELKSAGKIKAIGVSNWMLSNLKRMKSLGQELPAVNQVPRPFSTASRPWTAVDYILTGGWV